MSCVTIPDFDTAVDEVHGWEDGSVRGDTPGFPDGFHLTDVAMSSHQGYDGHRSADEQIAALRTASREAAASDIARHVPATLGANGIPVKGDVREAYIAASRENRDAVMSAIFAQLAATPVVELGAVVSAIESDLVLSPYLRERSRDLALGLLDVAVSSAGSNKAKDVFHGLFEAIVAVGETHGSVAFARAGAELHSKVIQSVLEILETVPPRAAGAAVNHVVQWFLAAHMGRYLADATLAGGLMYHLRRCLDSIGANGRAKVLDELVALLPEQVEVGRDRSRALAMTSWVAKEVAVREAQARRRQRRSESRTQPARPNANGSRRPRRPRRTGHPEATRSELGSEGGGNPTGRPRRSRRGRKPSVTK